MPIMAKKQKGTAAALTFAFLITGSLVPAIAQEKIPVMGFVANYNAEPARIDIFKKGLHDLGYRDGVNIKIEHRTARLDREYFDVVAEFIGLKVDLILAGNAPATIAASRSTSTIPIVMAAVNDPVGLGAVHSLEKPGTNVTGTTIFAPQLIRERLNILKRLVPKLDKVAMVLNGGNPNNQQQFALLKREAEALGLQAQSVDIRKPEDVPLRIAEARAFGAGALLNGVDSFVNSQRFAIAKIALEHKLPCFYTDKEYVVAGGLISLGPGHQEGYFGAAKYVHAVLKGAKPADLPIASPTQFTLSVSKSALEKFAIALPDDIKGRVTEWLP